MHKVGIWFNTGPELLNHDIVQTQFGLATVQVSDLHPFNVEWTVYRSNNRLYVRPTPEVMDSQRFEILS